MEINKFSDLGIYNIISEMFPDAHCELNYSNIFELTIATILSAQTNDIQVNKITPYLFNKYKDAFSLQNANINDVIEIIKPLGLSKMKANNIIKLSQELVNNFDGLIPSDFNELIKLPGIGRKTANVILAEGFKLPGLAVDTHVGRVSYKLRLTKSNDPNIIENDLKSKFDKNIWGDVHLKLLFFGRYFCTSKNPKCDKCPFIDICNK